MSDDPVTLLQGDAAEVLRTLPGGSVQTCITSPPYFNLRAYTDDPREVGREATPDAYAARLVAVMRDVRRVLAADGTLWLNLGDSYNAAPPGNKTPSGFSQTRPSRRTRDGNQETVHTGRRLIPGLKPKDLIGIPWLVAFALRADGWYLRSDVVWFKPNPFPESVTDRPSKAHEYLFLFTKSARYRYDADAVREPSGRNRHSVWSIPIRPYKGAHFATFPPALIEPCVLAGTRAGDVVLDPFCGSGSTGVAARLHGRRFVGIDLHPDYLELAATRLAQQSLPFAS
jgi:site-specific DNA-methyltransferase (cytosine-N4-specific)